MKVSVIMGVYNPNGEHLLRAVNSIAGQTLTDWELIICDDGSDVSYHELYQNIATADERITLIKNTGNYGLAYALNQCLSIAKGEYIARTDADDIAKVDRLEKQCKFLDRHRVYQWVGSNAELIDENGVWGLGKREAIPSRKTFLKHSPYIHPSVLFRADILKANGGYKVRKETLRCEDYELFMRLTQRGLQGYNLQECLLQYREDRQSYDRRKYYYYILEMKVRYNGFKGLGILNIITMAYVLKPLVVGLVPTKMMQRYRKAINKNGC